MLDSLGISGIEAPAIKDCQTDYYLVKSIASAVKGASVAVPVDIADAGQCSGLRTGKSHYGTHFPDT